MIIDGIFERHPTLMFGVIEQGAGWIPSWMRYLDSAYDAFARHEERLQKLSMRPSEYVRRQLRATPYPTEDVGWIVREAGAEIPLVLVGLSARRRRPQSDQAFRNVTRCRVGRRSARRSIATISPI